jgi:hypothetical protein
MRATILATVLATILVLWPAAAVAEDSVCKIVELEFQPQQLATPAMFKAPSQIVAWVEDTNGTYVDTVFITQATGTYGIGNRPGRMDFNSGPGWPYGRRTTVFPVWAHRHGLSFDALVFQDGQDDQLSHGVMQSSREHQFCRPIMPSETMWDAGTCASAAFTDKGVFSKTERSLYPPRNDLVRGGRDDASVDLFEMLNPLDAVSQPTPVNDVPANLTWVAPDTLPEGNYVLWVEVSREFDHNDTYSMAARPQPPNLPWAEYGAPYRGQPSLVYSVPFAITEGNRSIGHVLDYRGYGDPDGLDGSLRAPDPTITTGVAGSGTERFAVLSDQGTPYRVRVQGYIEHDAIAPGKPLALEVADIGTQTAKIALEAPGDDDYNGTARRYEVRYVVGTFMDDAMFKSGTKSPANVVPVEGGERLTLELSGLSNLTTYTVGIRAIDECQNPGPIAYVTFETLARVEGEVPWCFVATAAYGSAMAAELDTLRRFRDTFLQTTVLGELAIEAYYTLGPAIAGVVVESEVLRASARAVLDPIVATIKTITLVAVP